MTKIASLRRLTVRLKARPLETQAVGHPYLRRVVQSLRKKNNAYISKKKLPINNYVRI